MPAQNATHPLGLRERIARASRSIRTRFALFFILAITLILCAFGLHGHHNLSKELHARFEMTMDETQARVAISLAPPVWDFDKNYALSILRAEMLPPDVRSIQVYDRNGALFVSAQRNADGTISFGSTQAPPGSIHRAVALTHNKPEAKANHPDENKLGRVDLYFSNESIHKSLRENIARRAFEIFLIDLALAVTLVLSLRMVFTLRSSV